MRIGATTPPSCPAGGLGLLSGSLLLLVRHRFFAGLFLEELAGIAVEAGNGFWLFAQAHGHLLREAFSEIVGSPQRTPKPVATGYDTFCGLATRSEVFCGNS